jgi:murein tripeptide amidase MpaA
MHILVPILLALPAAAPQQPAPAPPDLVKVAAASPADFHALQAQGFDVDDHAGADATGHLTVYADDAEQARLAAAGWSFFVEVEDLPGFYAARAAAAPARAAVGSMGGFRTLAEIGQEMDRLAAAYPGLVSPKFSVGTSIQGRPIWAMRISTTPTVHDPNKPVAYYDAIHHAREPMSGESLLNFADWLGANYGTDPAVTRVVESRNLLFLPCINPDGYEYNRQTNPNGGGMWRKNRRNNGGSYGVDLNRNYDWEWGPQWSGSSGSPSSETYRGTAPFSEPETAAVRDLLAAQTPGMSISAHTYSNLWIYPWGYDTVYTSENALYRQFGAAMTANNGYAYGTAWEVLYTANGCSDDYHYGAHGTYAFTPEIGSSSDGFWPNPNRIQTLAEAVRPGYLMTAQWSGGWAAVQDQVWSELSGNGDAFREPGETWQLSLVLANQGAFAVSGSADLGSSDPLVTVSGGPLALQVPARGQGTVGPFTVAFDANAQNGAAYDLDLGLDYDGSATVEPLRVVLGRERLLAHDDMESAVAGWTVSNSTNWSWERAVPQQTSSGGQTVQPGSDNPAGSGTRCWVTGAAAGGSAGTNDVDGTTWLTSPRFAAGGFAHVGLEYARWFANLPGNAQDDVFLAQVSNDGGASWVDLEVTPNANSWQTVSFDLEAFVALTDAMRLRFRAEDNPNNDLTEALLDDLRLTTFSGLPTLGAWGEAAIGGQVDLFLDGPAGTGWQLLWSFGRSAGQTVGGVEGLYYLNGGPNILLGGSLGADGRAVQTVTVPNNAGLAGRTVYLQTVVDYGGPQAALSNALALPIG